MSAAPAADRTADAPKTIQQAIRAADAKRIVVSVKSGNPDSGNIYIWITKSEAKRLLGTGEHFKVTYHPGTRSLLLNPPRIYSAGITFEVV